MIKEIFILEFGNKLNGVNAHMDTRFLSDLLKKASGKEVPHCDLDLISKLEMKPTGKHLNNTVYAWVKYSKSIPLIKLLKLRKLTKISTMEVEKNIKFISTGKTKLPIFSPIKIDYKLGSVIGHILGDGSIDKKYNQVFFSNSNRELLNEFSNYMNEIFKVKPRIWMQESPDFGNTKWDKRLRGIDDLIRGRNAGLFYPTICGLILNTIFNNFAKGKDKKISLEIMKSNKEFKRGLIRAFYDDEGNVGKKNIRLFQDNKSILEWFKKTLLLFGISSSGVKVYFKRDKERYYFDIFRKTNFYKFRERIGFTSSDKKRKLDELCVIKNFKNSL